MRSWGGVGVGVGVVRYGVWSGLVCCGGVYWVYDSCHTTNVTHTHTETQIEVAHSSSKFHAGYLPAGYVSCSLRVLLPFLANCDDVVDAFGRR